MDKNFIIKNFIVRDPIAWFDSLNSEGNISRDVSISLLNEYSRYNRGYHNVHHIASMWRMHYYLRNEEDKSFLPHEQRNLARAVAFHDVVYDASSKTNEMDSIAYMNKDERYRNEWVSRAILASSDHFSRRDISCREDELVEWFVGLDLCSLGTPWDIFQTNTLQIRAEYGHLSDEEWIKGRNGFYKKALELRPIFQHPIFEKHFEDNAINNLERALGVIS